MNATKEQVKGAMAFVMAVADAIKELGTVPNGHLYANLMGHMSLENYQKVIDLLKRSGVVTESASHLLTWVGK